ncbi:cytochrome P450 [Streptomyces sp. RKND-216]|uniref:cytochrome P450 n=1 Tax=Streptomyces sp. RKND-216 TaxID=2562581 RepID=UPI00109E32BB|nr:cytochrome P450 [Streptomyces sp. RKND-216]THA24076.1 cytochrome P450 [Streptomyces sp. RKND-216]
MNSPNEPTVGPGPAAPPPGCPAHAAGTDGLRRLYGPEADADPMALYEKLRAEHGAVAPVLVHGDLPAWLVLGHRENLEVARTSTLFSRDSRRWRDMAEGNVPPDHPLTPMTAWQPLCVFADGPDHERLRRAVTDSLSRFEARGIRRYVTRFSHQLIDDFAAVGRADLVDQFAAQLPLRVVTQLFGMPEDYGPRLVDAARDMLGGTETAVASNDYLTETLQQLVERKRVTPGHDVASKLIEHPARLSDDEVREHLRVVLVSANEPTVNLIAGTLRLVLTDRRFRANLAGGHMTLPDALEQVLWDDPPMTTNLGRWATGDVELAGKRIKEGDLLILGLAAGNADPAIRPDTSTALHGNRSHLAFSGGPHECPGQDLGRAIADTGIDVLLSRLPDLRLAVPEEELTWNASLMSRPLAALPVRFTPGRLRSAKDSPAPEETAGAELPPQRSVPSPPAPADVPSRTAPGVSTSRRPFRRLRWRR